MERQVSTWSLDLYRFLRSSCLQQSGVAIDAIETCLKLQLRLRKVMDLAKQKTVSGTLNEFSMVLLNNLLSIPLGFALILIFENDILSM